MMFKKPCRRCKKLFRPTSKYHYICDKCRKPKGRGKIPTIMKCKLKISPWCEKTMSKKNTKIIEGKECCAICYWKQKQINREKRKEIKSLKSVKRN